MNITAIIPARFASTRFPGKPLANLEGKSMIQRVVEQALKVKSLKDVIVATDDDRIEEAVKAFGGKVVRTAESHQSGTDRCAEVARSLKDSDIIINIQGDEPFIDPGQIEALCTCFERPETQLASLYQKVHSVEELQNPNLPKIVMNEREEALYFSRWPVPYLRGMAVEQWLQERDYYKHIGIYGYRKDILLKIAELPPSPLERAESLEQLRWLENGFRIQLTETRAESHPVDTPEDLERVIAWYKQSQNAQNQKS